MAQTRYSSEPEVKTREAPPAQRLSNFVPTKSNVLHELDTEWHVSLKEGDVCSRISFYQGPLADVPS